ncbi:MAG: GerMN domain-containing protein [bacterium]
MNSVRNKMILILLTCSVTLISVIYLFQLYIKTHNINVYFVKNISTTKSELKLLRRPYQKGNNDRLNAAISSLLQGPTAEEQKQGYYTEIPEGTKLIEIKYLANETDINLSKEFNSEGGSESLEFGLNQIINTTLDERSKKPVYLEVEEQKVKYIGGEGLEVPQPLEKI